MPRNLSCFYTQRQVRNRTKTETRRLGWKFVAPGDELNLIVKGQGLKRGERVERTARVRVVAARREPLRTIDQPACVREGFPELTPDEFVAMFCKHMGCRPSDRVTVIRWVYLD